MAVLTFKKKKLSEKLSRRKREKLKQQEKLAKKEAHKQFIRQFAPLMAAVLLWFVTLTLLHLPSIKDEVADFFVHFTLNSSLLFGKVLFLPVESNFFPNITVNGYTMTVIMECTAYNFYIFIIFLSLFSPVKWKQRIITLLIFLGAVFVVNNMRFITMGYIGLYSQELFHYVHDYLWNILFGLMVFLIWVWRYRTTWDTEEEVKGQEKTD
ncbi:MAG: archaeosortase/exosortase family protein [Bacteroidales bacterium]|nr:archaeosortase/exosortase family protein [Bacteroidales bacterium]MCF6342685.1 archaeosortase/exosortase family protein [Bacteroidales bacterium]